jgi:hypothetical protein
MAPPQAVYWMRWQALLPGGRRSPVEPAPTGLTRSARTPKRRSRARRKQDAPLVHVIPALRTTPGDSAD